MEKKDELSIIMLISKLQKAADFSEISKEMDKEYLNGIISESLKYLLDIMAQIVETLLLKVNIPIEEAEAFAGQVKERPMGELFANFEAYDVQETRRQAREEAREEDIGKLIKILKELNHSKEEVKLQLVGKYVLDEEEAMRKVDQYWH